MKLIGVSIHVPEVDREDVIASLEMALKQIRTDYPGMTFELADDLEEED